MTEREREREPGGGGGVEAGLSIGLIISAIIIYPELPASSSCSSFQSHAVSFRADFLSSIAQSFVFLCQHFDCLVERLTFLILFHPGLCKFRFFLVVLSSLNEFMRAFSSFFFLLIDFDSILVLLA